MDLLRLFELQGTLFALMLVGAYMKRRGIVDDNGQKCLSDVCLRVVLPCNIFRSFLIEFNMTILQTCAGLLICAVIMQALSLFLNQFLFNRYPLRRKQVLQYCTIVCMSGFLGNPIAEGIYGSMGLLYASIFIVPMRIVMWSVGTSYFMANAVTDRREVA